MSRTRSKRLAMDWTAALLVLVVASYGCGAAEDPPDPAKHSGNRTPSPLGSADARLASLIDSVEDESAPGLQRIDAASELAKLGDPRAVPPLVAMLEDDMDRRTGVWSAAIPALGILGDPRGVPVLLEALELRDEDWLGREMAAVALGEIGDAAAVPALLHAASMVDTRPQAIAALAAIGDPRAVPLFVDVLAGGDGPDEVTAAERALVDLGPQAVPALREAETDPRPAVREAARGVLETIESAGTERGVE